jgi:hypothetical protein
MLAFHQQYLIIVSKADLKLLSDCNLGFLLTHGNIKSNWGGKGDLSPVKEPKKLLEGQNIAGYFDYGSIIFLSDISKSVKLSHCQDVI